MTVVVDGEDGGELTLVFSLPAARKLADPATAFAEARGWSRHVGVVGTRDAAVEAFVASHGIQQDYDVADSDKWLVMEEIQAETHTPRHVFVGTDVADRRIADYTGWEYRDVVAAAEKADWELDGRQTAGFVSWLRDRLG
jgi:hypothetical protein